MRYIELMYIDNIKMKTFISFGKKLFLIKPVSISIDRKKLNETKENFNV